MSIDFSKLHEPQLFTQEYIEALAQYQEQGHELPEYILVAVQTQQVKNYAALELPFNRIADAFWVNLGEFIHNFERYKSDPESQKYAFYYTCSSVFNRKGHFRKGYTLHATGFWK